MKRVALVVLFLMLTSFVRAEELETILQDEESLSGTGRSAFVTIELTDFDQVKALAGTLTKNFSIIGDVISKVTNEDEHNYVDFTPYNTWLTTPFNWLMPGQMKISKPYIPFTTPQTASAHYCAYLTINAFDIYPIQIGPVFTNDSPPEQSQGIESYPKFYEIAQSLSFMYSGAKAVTIDGRVNFNWPNFTVKRIRAEDCGRNDPYEDVKPKINDMTVRAQFSEGEIQSSVINTIETTIQKLVDGVWETITDYLMPSVPMVMDVTQKLYISGSAINALFGYWYNGRETAKVISDQTRTKHDGFVSSLVPFKLRKNPIGFAGTENTLILTGNVNEGKQYTSRANAFNRSYETGRQAACPVYSYQILKGKGPVKEAFKIGGVVPTDCSRPPTPAEEEIACNSEFSQNAINKAISAAENKYKIPEGMLKSIYEIEALDLGVLNPSDYVCKRNQDIPGRRADTSAGLTQLNDESYADVTCGKGMEDDVAQCDSKKEGQLSRCDINDTFELAARLLLFKVGKWDNNGCKATGTLTTNSEIYTAACRYGTGIAPTDETIAYDYNLPNPKRTNGEMNYCDIVCNKMGRCGSFYPEQVEFPPNW